MLKSRATELLRDPLDLFPQRVSSHCGGNRKKSFFRCPDRGKQWEGNLQRDRRWNGRWRPGFWSSVALGSLFWPEWYKRKVKGWHEKKTLMISQGLVNGALTLWRENFWAWGHEQNLPPNFQQSMRIKFWNFIFMLSVFERLTALSCPKSPCRLGPTHMWCAIQQTCGRQRSKDRGC